ncbi:YlbD family protein [Oceanobacillus jeddahense]|uniref:YlbD family protein n=1 Tax=Oceanobacillus jeddahense TaxID=1462527 RepID=A0ABY5JMY7_9BACI|nr:spore coat protein YlbD [Oceanobacillus jeddahense]UUI01649.1 YlbD family protein [Oceanobacillus jeddahense]
MSQLHPSVAAFKSFVNRHPKLLEEIRKSGKGWQEFYEKWAILDEDDPFWNEYKTESTEADSESKNQDSKKSKKTDHSDLIRQIMDYTQNLDTEKVQGQIEQLSKAIGVVQEMIGDMKKPSANKTPRAPFSLRKD